MLTRFGTETQPMVRLRSEMDRLFERFFGEEEPFGRRDLFALRRFPAVNVWEDDDTVFVEAELPGFVEKDIELTVTGNELVIKGARPALEPPKGTTVLRCERGSGEFSRTIALPVDVDEKKVEAAFRNGILTINLPKAEVARTRKIPIKAITG